MNAFRETVQQLGPSRSLIGVMTLPVGLDTSGEFRLVILLNAGILHRVGPTRLHVELARRLASQGHAALRFDFSGLGDSERREGDLSLLDSALTDIREVVDELTQRYPRAAIVVAGLCSGADHALVYVGQDERVRGAILLDPNIPRTRGYYVRYYGRRLFSAETWRNLLIGRNPLLNRLLAKVRPGAGAPKVDVVRDVLVKRLEEAQVNAYLAAAYAAAARRRVPLLCIFTAGVPSQHCYREQVIDAFPDAGLERALALEYDADADHTFENGDSRQRMFQRVSTWITSVVPASE